MSDLAFLAAVVASALGVAFLVTNLLFGLLFLAIAEQFEAKARDPIGKDIPRGGEE